MSETYSYTHVALAAQAAMAQRGISARKLALRLGMKPDTVLDFLATRRATRPSTRVSICRELGLNPDNGKSGAE